ncbi:hypothetical protein GOBAR_DD36266 [Gossypium barbadense]|nr:hypothetical protein GOBAR_DD36266 [Gossypium barbadense]
MCLMKEKRPDLEVREKSSDLVVGENSVGGDYPSTTVVVDNGNTEYSKVGQKIEVLDEKGIKTQGRKSELVNALGFTNLVKKVGKEGGPNLPTRLDATGAMGQSEVGCLLFVSDGATFTGNIKTDVKHVDGGK